MKTLVGIIILGAVVGGVYVLNDVTRTEDGKSLLHVARQLEVEVELTQPEQRDIVRTVQAPGDVEALDEVDISAEVVAKIIEMPVWEGCPVEKGQLLCRLDDADFKARVRSAEANVAKLEAFIMQAEADFEKAQRDCDRQKRLSESAATSVLEMADYRTALVRARAQLAMRRQELIEAEAALQSAHEYLAKTVITSPITGIVSQLFAKDGEVVITGTMNNPGTRIMVVSDLSKMKVRCRVDETDAALVHQGQMARVYLQSDTRKGVSGEVVAMATKGTKPQGRDVVTFETLVLITGDNPGVKPGMTANVVIEAARREEALIIPVESVVYRKRRDLPAELVEQYDAKRAEAAAEAAQSKAEYLKVVYCIEEGVAHPRLVETGISDATGVEILAGIASTNTIVTGPYRSLDQLKDGTPIKAPKEQAPAGSEKEEHPSEPAVQDASATAVASADEAGETQVPLDQDDSVESDSGEAAAEASEPGPPASGTATTGATEPAPAQEPER